MQTSNKQFPESTGLHSTLGRALTSVTSPLGCPRTTQQSNFSPRHFAPLFSNSLKINLLSYSSQVQFWGYCVTRLLRQTCATQLQIFTVSRSLLATKGCTCLVEVPPEQDFLSLSLLLFIFIPAVLLWALMVACLDFCSHLLTVLPASFLAHVPSSFQSDHAKAPIPS